jgi:hypothetical protein
MSSGEAGVHDEHWHDQARRLLALDFAAVVQGVFGQTQGKQLTVDTGDQELSFKSV